MVDSIKGSREIKKDKTGHPLTFHFKKKVIMNAQESSFSRVKFSKSRLESRNGSKGVEMKKKAF